MTPESRGLTGVFTRIAQSMSQTFDVEVVASGSECKTDGKRIYIPFTSDYLSAEKREVLHGMLDHEIAHVGEEREHEAVGRRSCLNIMADRSLNNAMKLLVNVFEDVRIENKWSARYPGVAQNLGAANLDAAKTYKSKPMAGADPWRLIGSAIIFIARGLDADWLPAELQPYLDAVADEIADCTKMEWSEDALALARRAYDKLKELDQSKCSPSHSDDGGEGDGDQEGQASGEDGDKSDGGADDGEGEKDGEDGEDKSKPKKSKKSKPLLDKDAQATDMLSERKDEIKAAVEQDARDHKRYIPHPDIVKMDRLGVVEDGELSVYDSAKADVQSQIGALRTRQLMLLQTEMRAKIKGGREEGELDDGELYRVRHGELNVFADVVRGKKLSVAIELLLDCSGSMGSNVKHDDTGACDSAYYALRTAIALAESWETLRIPHEVLGWTNNSWDGRWNEIRMREEGSPRNIYALRSPFVFSVFKGWDEKLAKCRSRFSKIRGYYDNADGEAVMFAARRLARRTEKRKILIVISDGYPNCNGLNSDLGKRYLKEVVGQVEQSGIEVVGIGAGTDAPKEFYTNHIVIKDLSTMAMRVFKALDKRVRKAA